MLTCYEYFLRTRAWRRLLLSICLLVIPCSAYAAEQGEYKDCGPPKLTGQVGPYDYTDPNAKDMLHSVESFHFSPNVENFDDPRGYILPELTYTLIAFPNHHRALNTLSRYEIAQIQLHQREGRTYVPPRQSFEQSAYCFFFRAKRFAPRDPTLHMLYGMHLHRLSKLDEALKEYKAAEQIAPESAEVHYNLGLLYLDRKDYKSAKQHAQKAYKLGFPLPGLRNRLASVGFWP